MPLDVDTLYARCGSAKAFLNRTWHPPLAGNRLFCQLLGERKNPALLLLHGLNASHRTYESVATALAREFFVLVPDLRLHGKSPVEGELVTFALLAEDLKNLLDQFGVEKLAVAGHSHGARLALKLAALLPHRVKVCIDEDVRLVAFKPTASVKNLKQAMEAAEAFRALGNLYGSRQELIGHLEKIFPAEEARRYGLALGEDLVGGSVALGNVAEHKVLDFLLKWEDLSDELKTFPGPLHLLRANPSLSKFCSESDVLHMRENAARFSYTYFPDSGHTIHKKDPAGYTKAVGRAVRRFLG